MFDLLFSREDGYLALTNAGNIVFLAIAVCVLLAVRFVTGKNRSFSAKQLVFSAASIALAFALSYVRIIRMPWGGAVTLCSMLFVTLVGNWYGPGVGFTTAFAYSMLQFVQDGLYLKPVTGRPGLYLCVHRARRVGVFQRQKERTRRRIFRCDSSARPVPRNRRLSLLDGLHAGQLSACAIRNLPVLLQLRVYSGGGCDHAGGFVPAAREEGTRAGKEDGSFLNGSKRLIPGCLFL